MKLYNGIRYPLSFVQAIEILYQSRLEWVDAYAAHHVLHFLTSFLIITL